MIKNKIYSKNYTFNNKLRFNTIFPTFNLFWHTYINNNTNFKRLILSLKINHSNNSKYIFKNELFNSQDFLGALNIINKLFNTNTFDNVTEIIFIYTFLDNDIYAGNNTILTCNKNLLYFVWSSNILRYLLLLILTCIINIVITIFILHNLDIINIYNYIYSIDLNNINNTTYECINIEKLEYKSSNNSNYLQKLLDLLINKDGNFKPSVYKINYLTFNNKSNIQQAFIPQTIKYLSDYYDLNTDLILKNRELLYSIDDLNSAIYKYKQSIDLIISENPLKYLCSPKV